MRVALALAVLTVLLAATAAAYSLWSQTLTVKTAVNTGELDVEVTSASLLDTSCSDPSSPDYVIALTNRRPDFYQYSQLQEPDSNVACGSYMLVDSDGDGDYDTIEVVLYNAYPRYYNSLSFAFRNNGNIPLKLWYIEIGREDDRGQYQVIDRIYLEDLGDLTDSDGVLLDLTGDGKPDIAVHLEDSLGDLIMPGQGRTGYTLQMAVLDDAPEASTLVFYVKPVAVQWNGFTESPQPR